MATQNIVFIHGFPFDHTMWDAQVEALTTAGHHVFAPDLPGFGGTKPFARREDYSLETLALSVAEVIQTMTSGKVVLAGLSMGGYIALTAWRLFPELITGLVLLDTRADADAPAARAKRMENITLAETQGTAPVADFMLERLCVPNITQPETAQLFRTMMLRQNPTAVAGALWAMAQRPDQTATLASITVPTLLICGEHDAMTPPNVMQAMAEQIPHSQLRTIAGATHMAPLDQPQAVNTALVEWLDAR
jgi:pimeloyl-ACP methyl ester carboxylesterase